MMPVSCGRAKLGKATAHRKSDISISPNGDFENAALSNIWPAPAAVRQYSGLEQSMRAGLPTRMLSHCPGGLGVLSTPRLHPNFQIVNSERSSLTTPPVDDASELRTCKTWQGNSPQEI
jgi:hypothetical protein